MTMFGEPEEYHIASYWLTYLANADASGLEEKEISQFLEWESEVKCGRQGHFCIHTEGDEDWYDDFRRCDICGKFAECYKVSFLPIIT